MQNRRSFIKKSGLLIAAGALPLSAFSAFARRNRQAETIVVTLYVNTATIDKKNINASSNFGQDPSITNEEFTIEANVGDTVVWEGVSANAPSTDVVNIVSINYQGGKNIFDQNILKSDGNSPEKVSGVVRTKTDDGKKYKYKISFTVTNNGAKRNGIFQIDPKIFVN
ncbi:MAG: AidA/PixA family protein [Bacteroidota bacterium]|nr:AidA/PixA family protein [Bacteroidota bacterium]